MARTYNTDKIIQVTQLYQNQIMNNFKDATFIRNKRVFKLN